MASSPVRLSSWLVEHAWAELQHASLLQICLALFVAYTLVAHHTRWVFYASLTGVLLLSQSLFVLWCATMITMDVFMVSVLNMCARDTPDARPRSGLSDHSVFVAPSTRTSVIATSALAASAVVPPSLRTSRIAKNPSTGHGGSVSSGSVAVIDERTGMLARLYTLTKTRCSASRAEPQKA